MVKILEIGCPLDVEGDDGCCEIDLAEFVKKVNLKAADDDVVVVNAKGPIKAKDIRKKKIKVKVEVDQSGDCSESNGNLHDGVAGDCFDNPYEVEEDETAIHQIMESADAKPDVKFDIKSPVKCESEGFQKVVPDVLPVKSEPEDGNSADEHFEQVNKMSSVKCDSEGSEEVVPDTSPVKSEHDEDGSGADEHFEQVTPDISQLKFGSVRFEEVVADMSPVKIEHEDGTGADEHFEEVVIPDVTLLKCEFECFEEFSPDMSPVRHEPEDGNGADERVEEEDAYDHIPEMDRLNGELYPGGSVFDEADGDDFVVVGREAL